MLDVLEDDVRAGLERCLGLLEGDGKDRFKIILPRKKVPLPHNGVKHTEETLVRALSYYASPESFKISMKEFKESSIKVDAFVTFTDLDIAQTVLESIQRNRPHIEGSCIQAGMELKTSIVIFKDVSPVVEPEVRRLMSTYTGISHTNVRCFQLKSGHHSLEIKSQSMQNLAEARVKFDDAVRGTVLKGDAYPNLSNLFGRAGKEILQAIAKQTDTLIKCNERRKCVTIQGLAENKRLARTAIEKNLTQTLETSYLKSDVNVLGLIKALFSKYGVNLSALKDECDLTSIHINMRNQKILLTGTEQAIASAHEKITSVKNHSVKQIKHQIAERELPDCPVCLCPVEETDNYRLEMCGHAYCNTCI